MSWPPISCWRLLKLHWSSQSLLCCNGIMWNLSIHQQAISERHLLSLLIKGSFFSFTEAVRRILKVMGQKRIGLPLLRGKKVPLWIPSWDSSWVCFYNRLAFWSWGLAPLNLEHFDRDENQWSAAPAASWLGIPRVDAKEGDLEQSWVICELFILHPSRWDDGPSSIENSERGGPTIQGNHSMNDASTRT